MHRPWNDWYHCVGNTYGTWLRGDPRGFRTRHHRQHIEGDYKHPPPPGAFTAELEQSKRSMTQPPVKLTPHQRQVVLDALVVRLHGLDVTVLALAVCRLHTHGLMRFPVRYQVDGVPGLCKQNALQDGRDPVPRHLYGLARKHAAMTVDLKGRVWAKRPHFIPIRNRQHQVNVFRYVLDHLDEGGAIYESINGRFYGP